MRRWAVFAFLAPFVCFALHGDQRKPDPVQRATAFLASLSEDQRAKVVLPFDGDYRTLWRYTPATRQGISWKDMDADQTAKAQALLRDLLSELGYQRTQDIRTLEQVLRTMENNNPGRDKDNYLFTFFGTPSETGTWACRYEGHHISLNFTFRGGVLIAGTPQFFGSNPAEVQSGDKKGMRLLGKEEDSAITFLASLTDEQKKLAIVSNSAPNEIFTAENRQAARQDEKGIKFTQLNANQQKELLALIRLNAEAQTDEEAKHRMDKIDKAGHDKIVFTWMGAPDRSAAHYYRIQGPTFLIEFDNSQNRANHIHLVWRDFDGDFGRDVLKEHYEQHEHDPAHGHDHH